MELVLGVLVVFGAYSLKGFSGFGPALIMVPFMTILFSPITAISVTTLFDLLADCILIFSVWRSLNWRFVFSVVVALAMGTIVGTLLLGSLPTVWLRRIMGGAILLSGILILVMPPQRRGGRDNLTKKLKFPIGFLSGVFGGLLSISGPPLVVYMKMVYEKSYFRTQLIGIFLFSTGWRYLLYQLNKIPMNLPLSYLAVFFVVMIIGLWVGTHFHLQVNENIFNKTVACILFIPSVHLLLSS